MKKLSTCLFILLFALLAAGCDGRGGEGEVVSGAWDITMVDSDGNVGEFSSIAVDGSGKVHIAYFDHVMEEQIGEDTVPYGDLKYTTDASGVWEAFTLDNGSGMTPRIFVDHNNKVHIVHSSLGISDILSLTDLRYTTNASGSWETVAISSQVVKGSDASIVVDSNGAVHICAWNNEGAGTTSEGAQGGLRYITNATGEWTWVDVDSSPRAGNDTDIAVDGNDRIHISYLDKDAGLKYATNVDGSWTVSLIDDTTHVGWNTSIMTDHNNHVHISYSDPASTLNPPGNGYLKYATNESGAWVLEIVDDQEAGFFTGLAVDEAGVIHIAYYAYREGAPGKLRYVTNSSGEWVKETVDAAEFVGLYCAIDLDPNGNPHISHYDYVNQSLVYAKRSQ
jgi:hypothetical protein